MSLKNKQIFGLESDSSNNDLNALSKKFASRFKRRTLLNNYNLNNVNNKPTNQNANIRNVNFNSKIELESIDVKSFSNYLIQNLDEIINKILSVDGISNVNISVKGNIKTNNKLYFRCNFNIHNKFNW